jgi:hypothetical protein
MANKLENEVKSFLRPSEDVKITLETIIAGKRIEEDDGKNQRILAVVTHQNEVGEEREGRCVFYGLTDHDCAVHRACAVWSCASRV